MGVREQKMKIADKILELLNYMVFQDDSDHDFFVIGCEETTNNDCHIGLRGIDWYNFDIFGNSFGKLLKNGLLEYKQEHYTYCMEWADCFFKDINLFIYGDEVIKKHKNVYNYLNHLSKKMKSLDNLKNKLESEYPELLSLYDIEVELHGEVGKEIIKICEIPRTSPLYLLENFDWLSEYYFITDQNEDIEDIVFDTFLKKMKENEDIANLSMLFSDRDVIASKRIEKLENGEYKVIFGSWNIWKNSDIDWIETIGEMVQTPFSYFSQKDLVITGTYQQIETMINLLRGA